MPSSDKSKLRLGIETTHRTAGREPKQDDKDRLEAASILDIADALILQRIEDRDSFGFIYVRVDAGDPETTYTPAYLEGLLEYRLTEEPNP